jgi:hypothetical protein
VGTSGSRAVTETAPPHSTRGSERSGTPAAPTGRTKRSLLPPRLAAPAFTLGALLALTAALWILYGPAHLSYDPTWAMSWGDDLASGRVPDLGASPAAPTPHPLANLLGVLVAPLGESAAPIALELLAVASFAALGLVSAALGRELFALPVGAFFALLVLTEPTLVHQALISSTDIAFVALALGALLLVAKDPRRGFAPLGLLAAAGLLRPEGWGFALAYGAYLVVVARPPRRLALAGLAVLAPAAWMLADLALTGNPLFSLQGTQELAAALGRPRGLDVAVAVLPDRLDDVVGQTTLSLGLLGWAVALLAFFERALLPSLVVLLGIGGWLVLGMADLPLLTRYMVVPGVLLILFAAVLVFGWACLERGGARTAWMIASLVPVAAIVASLPGDFDQLREEHRTSAASHAAERDLKQLVTSPAGRRALGVCRPVRVPDFRVRPFVWYWADIPPETIGYGFVRDGAPGTYVTPGTGRDEVSVAARSAFHKTQGVPKGWATLPSGGRVAASTDGWRLDVVGCP